MIKETEVLRGKKAYEIDSNLVLWETFATHKATIRGMGGRAFLVSSVGLNPIGLNN